MNTLLRFFLVALVLFLCYKVAVGFALGFIITIFPTVAAIALVWFCFRRYE